MRLFVALSVPSALKDVLSDARRRLFPEADRAVRWVKPAGIHLTLKFLGEVEASVVQDLSRSLSAISAGTFAVDVRGIGFFPNRKRVRVVWAGCEEPAGRLRSLQDAVEEQTSRIGFAGGSREYHPHLTLGRARDRGGAIGLREALPDGYDEEFGTFDVSTFELMESRLQPGGAVYRTVQSWPLGPGEAA